MNNRDTKTTRRYNRLIRIFFGWPRSLIIPLEKNTRISEGTDEK